MNNRLLLIAVIGALLSACGVDKAEPNKKPAIESVLEVQLDALEKAENVEDALREQKEARDKAMREQGT